MNPKTILLGALGILVVGGFALTRLLGGAPPEPSAPSPAEQIEHGKYLVTQVAMCVDCHSPRGPDGQFVAGRELTGTPLGFAPTVPMPWAPAAPGIAGLPAGYTARDTVLFLTTGKRPHGLDPARPPMPEYRMSQADAEAIAAYLASLRTDVASGG